MDTGPIKPPELTDEEIDKIFENDGIVREDEADPFDDEENIMKSDPILEEEPEPEDPDADPDDYEGSFQSVADRIDNEGFSYCFINYSNFEEVKDAEFHKLREAYITAHDNLELYVEKKQKEEEQIRLLKLRK